jgi:hypothetical protein
VVQNEHRQCQQVEFALHRRSTAPAQTGNDTRN